MLIGFIGDSHGQWGSLYEAIEILRSKGVEKIIQVGDFGYWDDSLTTLKLKNPLYFIDGNHEQFPLLLKKAGKQKNPVEVHPNLLYIPRGITIKWGGSSFGFLGGGFSVDFALRKDGFSWFSKEEAPKEEEANRIKQVDIMVTHDVFAEATFYNQFKLRHSHEEDRKSRQILQALFERVQPKSWVHGHYHQSYSVKVRDCEVRGLGCAPDLIIYDTEKKRFMRLIEYAY